MQCFLLLFAAPIVLFSLLVTTNGGQMCFSSWTSVQSACLRPFMNLYFREMANQFCANLNGVLCKSPVNEEQNTELFREICPHLFAKNGGRSPVQLSVPLAHGGMEVMLCFHGQPTTTWEQQAWMMPSSSFSANQMPFQFGGFSADAAQRKTGQSVQNVAAPQMGPPAATAAGGGSTLEQQPTAVGRANSSPSLITPKPTNPSSSFSSSSSSSSPSPSSPQSTAAVTLTIPTATTSLAGTDPPKAKNSSPSYFKKILNGLWG
ncbi:hypothetical protein niasHT_000443 [Heterodera trifolii]|uniref:C-type lectin domain-containing protein n=1 Tax=Heterodera trifolii TaxID=157864 RepID=A0ABD2M2Y6_9BILA